MKRLLPFIAMAAIGAVDHRYIPPPRHEVWETCTLWGDTGEVYSSTDNTVSFGFVYVCPKAAPVSFLTTPCINGDLTGETITASISITTTGRPCFVYGFEGYPWNTCPSGANVRLYFSCAPGPYDLDQANADECGYWWADFAAGSVNDILDATLTASLTDPSQWSDSQGVSGADEPEAFFVAVQNIAQVGLAFGGGCFYDTGVGIGKGGGSATFHLKNYVVQ